MPTTGIDHGVGRGHQPEPARDVDVDPVDPAGTEHVDPVGPRRPPGVRRTTAAGPDEQERPGRILRFDRAGVDPLEDAAVMDPPDPCVGGTSRRSGRSVPSRRSPGPRWPPATVSRPPTSAAGAQPSPKVVPAGRPVAPGSATIVRTPRRSWGVTSGAISAQAGWSGPAVGARRCEARGVGGADGLAAARTPDGTGATAAWRVSHGLTTAAPSASATTTTPTTIGSTRRRLGRSGTGSKSMLTGSPGDTTGRAPPDQPASGTIRPSASIVACRRRRLSSAPGTWSRA